MLNKENNGVFVFGSDVLSLSFRGSSFFLQPSNRNGFLFSFCNLFCFGFVYFLKLLLALTKIFFAGSYFRKSKFTCSSTFAKKQLLSLRERKIEKIDNTTDNTKQF